ncbi:EAL domain-containing protein [Pelagibacterium halotolerans]|uniref:sensor domain-containing protein n=1 Tax=Pelagibacterium halotolerans TaxID=531813 RepID=UPI00384D673A
MTGPVLQEIREIASVANTQSAREHTVADSAWAIDLQERAQTSIYQHAMAAMNDGVVILSSKDYSAVACNAAFARMLGFNAPQDVIGLHPWDWDPGATRKGVHSIWSAHPKEGFAPTRFETRHRHRDGSTHDVEISCFAFHADGEIFSFNVVRDITEVKRMRTERDAAEFRMRLAAESAGIGIWEWDAQTDRVETCPQYSAVLGVAHGEIATGQDWISRVHPDDMERFAFEAARALDPEQDGFKIELRLRDGDGGYRWISDSCRVVERDASGKPLRLVGTIRNIDERKKAEHLLREREGLLSVMFDQVPGAIALMDEETRRIIQFNDHAAAMHGYTREEFSSLGIADLRISPLGDALDGRYTKIRETGVFALEGVHKRKDGSTFDVQIRSARIKLDDRWCALTIWTDVSELKQVQRALGAREEEVRTLVEHSPDGMIRYDRDLRRIYVNAAMHNLIGSNASRLTGRRARKPSGVVDPAYYIATLQEVFRTGNERQIEVEHYNPSVAMRWSLVNFVPEFDEKGEVATVLATIRDITELVDQREKIRQLAYSDTLTGIVNRTGFNERFAQVLAGCRGAGKQAALLLFDLDRFKDVNDSLGHSAGDEMLREIGARLSRSMRRGDILARLGGDEFAVLLPDLRRRADVETVVRRIRQALRAPFNLCDREVFTSAAIGISIFPDDGQTMDELSAHADAAMYDAKAAGPNSVRFYARELSEAAATRLALTNDIKQACGNGELELVYQPKILLADGVCIGAEALLRWRHPEHGLLGPDKFISIAEQTGAIVEVGRWVLFEACRTVVEWNARVQTPLRVAVNLSSRQFVNNDVAADIREALLETGCRPEWLECEITESLILQDEQGVHEALAELARMGITVAIDDFGTGQSALAYLNRFDVDVLKIDRSFVSDMETDWRKAELVKAFISLAQALDMETVAEGIETSDQARILLRLGCKIGQGYHFSKPLSEAQFRERHVLAAALESPALSA